MEGLRVTINGRLGTLGWTKADLVRAVQGKVGKQTVYEYLDGKTPGSGPAVEAMMQAVRLVVVPQEELDLLRSKDETVRAQDAVVKDVCERIVYSIRMMARDKVAEEIKNQTDRRGAK